MLQTGNQAEKPPQTLMLSALLRQSTMEAHKEAEGASFIKDLFRGQVSDQQYVEYLWALKEVYSALESEMFQHKKNQAVALIFFPELFRVASLNKDLELWQQGQPLDVPPQLKQATQIYVDHLRTLSATEPALLVAHAYVRFLGDLSGGQMLGKILNKRFPNHPGLSFYHYDFTDTDDRKNIFRNRLDEIGNQTPEIMPKIAAEAQKAFELNGLVFGALSEKA